MREWKTGLRTWVFLSHMQELNQLLNLKIYTFFLSPQVDIFSYRLLLLPIHLGAHWCLCVVKPMSKEIQYFDSLKQPNDECMEVMKSFSSAWKGLKASGSFVLLLDCNSIFLVTVSIEILVTWIHKYGAWQFWHTSMVMREREGGMLTARRHELWCIHVSLCSETLRGSILSIWGKLGRYPHSHDQRNRGWQSPAIASFRLSARGKITIS